MLLEPFNFHSPKNTTEAIKLCEGLDKYRILAGGTFLINNLKLLKRKGLKAPEHIISLSKISDLNGILKAKDTLTIKAMTSINAIAASTDLDGYSEAIKTAAEGIATTPIRNMATIGGNLTCRYTWTELPAVMIALGANMHFLRKNGKENIIPAEEFYKNGAKTTELFEKVTIKEQPSSFASYQRVSKLSEIDIPLLAVCIKATINKNKFSDTRVVINNTKEFAQRDTKLENFLNTSSCDAKVSDEALKHLDKILYAAEGDDYKSHISGTCVKNAITELISKSKK